MFEFCFFGNFCYLLPQSNSGSFTCAEGLCPLSLKKKKTDEKTNVTARDEGEESSYIASDFENPMLEDTIPEVKRSVPYGYFPYQLLIWTMRSIFETNACLFTILNSGS